MRGLLRWAPLLLCLLCIGAGSEPKNPWTQQDNEIARNAQRQLQPFLMTDGYPKVWFSAEELDAKGYVWCDEMSPTLNLRTFYRFDGLEFENMSARFRSRFNDTLSSCIVRSRRPYFISHRGCAFWDGDDFIYQPFPKGDSILSIFGDKAGRVVLVGRKGVSEWAGNQLVYRRVKQFDTLGKPNCQLLDRTGRLWMAFLPPEFKNALDKDIKSNRRVCGYLNLDEMRFIEVTDSLPPANFEKRGTGNTPYEGNDGRIWRQRDQRIQWFDGQWRDLPDLSIPGIVERVLIKPQTGDFMVASRTRDRIFLHALVYNESSGNYSYKPLITSTPYSSLRETRAINPWNIPTSADCGLMIPLFQTDNDDRNRQYYYDILSKSIRGIDQSTGNTTGYLGRFLAYLDTTGRVHCLHDGKDDLLPTPNGDRVTSISYVKDCLSLFTDLGFYRYTPPAIENHPFSIAQQAIFEKDEFGTKLHSLRDGNIIVESSGEDEIWVKTGKGLAQFDTFYSPPEPVRQYLYSGDDDWFLSTAGHLLKRTGNRWISDSRVFVRPGVSISPYGIWMADEDRLYKLINGSFVPSPMNRLLTGFRLTGVEELANGYVICSGYEQDDAKKAKGDDDFVVETTRILLSGSDQIWRILTSSMSYHWSLEARPGEFELLTGDTYYSPSLNAAYCGSTWGGDPNRNLLLNTRKGTLKVLHKPVISWNLFTELAGTRDDLWLYGTNTICRQQNGKQKFYPITGPGYNCTACRDALHNLWFTGGSGVYRYDPIADRMIHYGEQDGLPSTGVIGIAPCSTGGIWILTNKALLQFTEPYYNGTLDISALRADTLNCPLNRPVVIPYRHNTVEIDYKIVTMQFPQDCTYSYFLNGFSDDWSPITRQRSVRYEKLPPGRYTLTVRGWLKNGREVPRVNVAFRILSPWYLTWLAILFYILSFFGGLLLFIRLRTRVLLRDQARLTALVDERTEELQDANQALADEQRRISDSIHYAAYIQRSILPHPDEIARLLPENFVFWREKDVVGGDFYWVQPVEDGVMIAVADCTGHGVPGALLTMSANSLLNSIVREKGVVEPADVLRLLHEGIAETLRQHADREQQDGLDIVLIRLDSNRAVYSGARLSLRMVRKSASGEPELTVYKGARFSLGGVKGDKPREFVQESIPLQSGDRLYLATDGFPDQAVWRNGKALSLGSKQFETWILEMQDRPVSEQGRWLETHLDAARGGLEQRDDITVICLETGDTNPERA
jgi:serine phosphatase RsbU (regulator of sigma subunit)